MLNKHDRYYKEYLKLIKRLNEVRKQIWNQPLVECIPYQYGWNAFITLREDILNRDDADFLLDLIKIAYNEKTHIDRIEYVRLIRKGIYYQIFHRKNYHNLRTDFIPKRKHLSKKEYESLSERQKPYFSKYINTYHSRYHYGNDDYYYKINIPLYWIRLKVKPNMITQMRDMSPELQSEYKSIRNQLEKEPYRKHFYEYGRYREDSDKRNNKYSKEQANIEIQEYVEQIHTISKGDSNCRED